MAKLTKFERTVASRYRKHIKAKDAAKKFYDRADELLEEIAHLLGEKSPKPLMVASKTGQITFHRVARIREDGRELHCIDKAAGENLVIDWVHGCVRRYELTTVDP